MLSVLWRCHLLKWNSPSCVIRSRSEVSLSFNHQQNMAFFTVTVLSPKYFWVPAYVSHDPNHGSNQFKSTVATAIGPLWRLCHTTWPINNGVFITFTSSYLYVWSEKEYYWSMLPIFYTKFAHRCQLVVRGFVYYVGGLCWLIYWSSLTLFPLFWLFDSTLMCKLCKFINEKVWN